ncbi:hypothetical protein SAMN04515695_0806 [Pseudovibrio sp. Tun.PSC04-5.I4]|nr:hypothetical protein SAMN04515695_0806 [Pseudovibrio sp. Tun.PSC04-5.I4]
MHQLLVFSANYLVKNREVLRTNVKSMFWQNAFHQADIAIVAGFACLNHRISVSCIFIEPGSIHVIEPDLSLGMFLEQFLKCDNHLWWGRCCINSLRASIPADISFNEDSLHAV